MNLYQYAPNPLSWIDPWGWQKNCKDPVKKYEVGTYDQLKARSASCDGLAIHHLPQKHPAGQVIPGHDPKTGPAIALPTGEHIKIPTQKGVTSLDSKGLLQKDLGDLRAKTNAPESSIQELIKLNQEMYI